jgi:glucose uptake protein GlcU
LPKHAHAPAFWEEALFTVAPSHLRFAMFYVETRISSGAAIFFSWLSVSIVLETGGGVLSRGTPKINKELISIYISWETGGI